MKRVNEEYITQPFNQKICLILLFLFLLSFTLYLMTLAPDFLWSDSAKLALYVNERLFYGVEHHLHPLHTVLGLAFAKLPLPLAYTQNLMSAFMAAIAVSVLFLYLYQETRNRRAALLSACTLAVSHLFWHYAVINETYSMVAAVILLMVFTAHRYRIRPVLWKLYLLAFLAGLGYGLHGFTLLFLPGVLAIVWSSSLKETMKSPHPISLVFTFTMGAFPVFILPLFYGWTPWELLSRLWTGSQMNASVFLLNFAKLLRELVRYPLYLAYQFPSLGLILGIIGLVTSWKSKDKATAIGLTLLWVCTVFFSSLYFFQRQFAMLIPSFVVFAIWIGFGMNSLHVRFPALSRSVFTGLILTTSVILPPITYLAAWRIAESRHFPLPIRRLPYRNEYRYFFFPPKFMEYGAVRYTEDAFRQAEPGAVILADFNPGMALLYAQKVLGMRRDLIIDIRIDEWVHTSPNLAASILSYLEKEVIQRKHSVYLADNWAPYYRTEALRNRFKLTQDGGPLWHVKPFGITKVLSTPMKGTKNKNPKREE